MLRTSKKHNKIKIIVPILAVALLATTVAVYAVSRNTSIIQNELKVAGSGVRIIEDSVSGFGKKEVTFKNEGEDNATVLLRIAYSETWTNSDGTVVSNVASNNANVVAKNWTTAFVNQFADGHDGWYYYAHTLAPGEEVKVLDSIALSDSDYAKYDYDLSFRFEAIQADSTAATTLWGKAATIGNDGAVTWAL